MKKTLVGGAAVLLLAGCSRSWVPELPDFSSWFNKENIVLVDEVAAGGACNAAGEQTTVAVLPDAAAVRAWERGRGIAIVGDYPLDRGPFAVIDLGQREAAGHGFAVSRQAGFKDQALVLKATFFTPEPGQSVSRETPSPCALVKLPDVPFKVVRVIDQDGRVRASSAMRP